MGQSVSARRDTAGLRRLIKASAIVIGAGLVVTGCSSVRIGSAAITTSQRITIATLNNRVTNLNEAARRYPGIVDLSAMQATQQTLTWLIRYQINDELARQNGITVTTAEAEAALAEIYASAEASAQAQGLRNVTPDLILAANGIPPDTSRRARPVSGHRDPVRQERRRRHDTHVVGGPGGRGRQARPRPVRGGQGPGDPRQPAVRADGLHPGAVPGRLRPVGGGSVARAVPGGLPSRTEPAC
jgi:hypothetical protein